MASFPSALSSVFRGRAAPPAAGVQHPPRPWPIFKLVASTRVETPPTELVEVVEGEIIPRLRMAHPNAATAMDPDVLAATQAQAFVAMALSRNSDALGEFVAALQRDGVDHDVIYADFLAPVARLLADLWQEDRLSYTEVTIGLGRLQQLIRSLEWSTPYNGDNEAAPRSALFTPRPGEQQTFGFYMIEELFRWSGWRTWIETCSTNDDLVVDVRCNWFDMVCLSVSRASNIEEISATIKTVRRASRNQDLFVVLNGSHFIEHPECVATLGADAVASCGREALNVADKAVRRLATD